MLEEQIRIQYSLNGSQLDITTLGNGHINDTFLIKAENTSFVLQRVNHHVFPDAKAVVNNALLINQHLSDKIKSGEYCLELIDSYNNADGNPYWHNGDDLYRALRFIPGCKSIEIVDSPQQAYDAANAFGEFTCALFDFDAPSLATVIPKFHDLNNRIEQLKAAVEKNAHNRVKECQALIDACLNNNALIESVDYFTKNLPIRVTHNDTKINNLLFKDGEVAAVIDLDTCMPGYLMHDFGDMVRTFCCKEPEDSINLSKVEIRDEIFKSLVGGYLSAFGDELEPVEKQSLKIGAQVMPFMLAVRFLTDHINGDVYFKIHKENHNLDRAKNQFKLYQSVSEKSEAFSYLFDTDNKQTIL